MGNAIYVLTLYQEDNDIYLGVFSTLELAQVYGSKYHEAIMGGDLVEWEETDDDLWMLWNQDWAIYIYLTSLDPLIERDYRFNTYLNPLN